MKVFVIGMNTDIDSFWNIYTKKGKKEYGRIPDYMFCKEYNINKSMDSYVSILKDMDIIFEDCDGACNVENNYMRFINK